MRKEKTGLLLLMGMLLLMLAFVPACSDDDDDNPTNPTPDNAPTFGLGTEEQIELPAGLTASSDPHAAQVVAFTAMTNAFSGYTSFFTPPTKAATGPPWVTTWNITSLPEVDMTITFTVDETADSYTWEYKIDGFDEDGTYDNVVFYAAEAAKDESWGEMYIYDPEVSTTTPVFSWEWNTSALGVYTMEMETFDDDPMYIEWVINPDGSGSLDVNEWFQNDWRIVWHFDWTLLGNGNWIMYNYDGGANESGAWGIPDTM